MEPNTPAEEPNHEHFAITVTEGQQLLRIDKFLQNFLVNKSRHKIQVAIKQGAVLVNEKVVKANYKVHPKDEISIVFPYPQREQEIVPEDIPLNIVYEDDQLAVINKPSNMVVHPGYGNWNGTLVNALVYRWQNLPSQENGDYPTRPGLVHRLDKDTSGLLVVAKTEDSLNHLSAQFFHKTTERTYHTLVWGRLKEEQGTVEGYLDRSLQDRKVMALYDDETKGKWSKTHYKVLKRYRFFTLVECKLETGRTHQIRVHMKSLGHPVFGDEGYGGDKILFGERSTKYKQFISNCQKLMPRQALHAKTLGFEHPKTKEKMFFESELATDFNEILQKIDIYAI